MSDNFGCNFAVWFFFGHSECDEKAKGSKNNVLQKKSETRKSDATYSAYSLVIKVTACKNSCNCAAPFKSYETSSECDEQARGGYKQCAAEKKWATQERRHLRCILRRYHGNCVKQFIPLCRAVKKLWRKAGYFLNRPRINDVLHYSIPYIVQGTSYNIII